MDYIFLTGIIGSGFSVAGAAWPEKLKIKPWQSVKNWLFALGGLSMLLYAILGFMEGAPIFYVFLELMVVIASVLMMLDTDDRIDFVVISIFGLGFIVWSLMLLEGINTVFFILGLVGVALGYTFEAGKLRRTISLLIGSILIAVFSYIESSWIFFWLNVFFAIFSAYYLYIGLMNRPKKTILGKIKKFLFHKK